MNVSGKCDERFAIVREEFEKNLNERGDVGASFAATIEGEYVIDLWGGYRNADKTLDWQEDSIVNVYSTSKTMTFISALVLADRGQLDFDAPVAEYWPEFAANGKQAIPVRNLLSHSAGLPGFSREMQAAEIFDWQTAIEDLQAQAPWWEPGTQSGYHAITQGFLIGEVIRRITGQTMGTWFRQNIAEPLGADFQIGVKQSDLDRVADLVPDQSSTESPMMQMDPESIGGRVFGSLNLGNDVANSEAWRRAEIPAANGHGNAHSVVRAQTALANDGTAFGQQLLSPTGCAVAREVQLESTDLVLQFPIKFAMGYAYGNEMLPVSPNKNAIWWAGAGGSTVVIDSDNRMCFSYVMNQMKSAMIGDERSGSLTKALYSCL